MGKYFTFTSVHLATLALKDEQIAALRNELSVARADRLRAEEARDAAVTKSFELLTPKPVEVLRPEARVREPKVAPKTLDLAEVDPTDNVALRDLALAEMSGKANATHLMQKMESIRGQVYMARAAKSERAREVGTVRAPAEPVPEDINAMIDNAIAQGKQQARTQ